MSDQPNTAEKQIVEENISSRWKADHARHLRPRDGRVDGAIDFLAVGVQVKNEILRPNQPFFPCGCTSVALLGGACFWSLSKRKNVWEWEHNVYVTQGLNLSMSSIRSLASSKREICEQRWWWWIPFSLFHIRSFSTRRNDDDDYFHYPSSL